MTMKKPGARLPLLVFLVVLAPLGAAVLITALLLFGVAPRLVFAPGHGVIHLLARFGIDAPNAVGVIVTVGSWWAAIAAAGLVWEARRR